MAQLICFSRWPYVHDNVRSSSDGDSEDTVYGVGFLLWYLEYNV